MAFRLLDFGIPNFDTNVEYLYAQAVEKGESILAGDAEYLRYQMGDTNLNILLRFRYEEDGETPKEVTAHTVLENDVRWKERIVTRDDGTLGVKSGDWVLPAELVNPEASGETYMPLLFVDTIRFGKNQEGVGAPQEAVLGQLSPHHQSEVALYAKVANIIPVLMSKMWLYSIVILELEEGKLVVPVNRDTMEDQLLAADIGGVCYARGQLSLQREWS